MRRLMTALGRTARYVLVGIGALAMIAGGVRAANNYLATVPGSGTNFAGILISAVMHPVMILCDATLGEAQCAAVKAASTAPAATDPALVVAISPNGINVNGQATSANSAPVVIASDQSGSCTLHSFLHITSATDTLAVQGVGGQTVRVCAWKARAAGAATWYWENTASANANCSSTKTQISGVATEAANTGEVVALPLGVTLNNSSGNGLCVNSTGTGGVDIDYWYAQR